MAKAPKQLSQTARAMLTTAVTHADRLIQPPKLPAAAARQVVRSLLRNGLAVEIPATLGNAIHVWRTSEDGTGLTLRATDQALAAMGDIAPAAASEPAPLVTSTQAVTECRSQAGCAATITSETEAPLLGTDTPVAKLDAPGIVAPAMATARPARVTKKAAISALLQRPQGVTMTELTAATGWLEHSVRAALTGLRKEGHEVTHTKRPDRGSTYAIAAAAG